MKPTVLSKAAEASRVLAALLAVVVAGRFAYVAVAAASAQPASTASPAASSSSSSSPPRGADRAGGSGTSATRPSSSVPPGTAIRVRLMVTAGPDRSDLYADDQNLGKTPFVGDYSCRVGEVVKLRVVPPKGEPIVAERPCGPGTLRLEP